MPMQIIRQRAWTERELKAAGFRYYTRRKQLVMAGRLPRAFAPLRINYGLEFAYAQAGDVIIYEPGDQVRGDWRAYAHWSVKPEIFKATYRAWDEPNWIPTPSQRDLMRYNCRPYYKVAGAWAKRLTAPLFVQSLESPEPVQVPDGFWLLIGDKGEPWHNDNETFQLRYNVSASVG